MKVKQIVKVISIPAKTVTYLLLLLGAVLIIQGMTWGLADEYWRKYYIEPARKRSKSSSKPKLTEAEKKQKAVSGAVKEVLPDGTIHLVRKDRSSENVKTIYSVDGDILWKREADEKAPYKYVQWTQDHRGNRLEV